MKRALKSTILVVALGLIWAAGVNAAQVNPPQTGFGVTGVIQEATVANVGTAPLSDPRLRGGYLTVNGIKMIVPNNTIVQLPAGAFTWADLFDPSVSASVPSGKINIRPGQSGLALADNPLSGTRSGSFAAGTVPFPAYNVSVVGNITTDPGTGEQKYIIGLIAPIEQQVLHNGAGLINYIDYTTGRFRVGGIAGNPNTGTLCELNDPVGRWGLVHSPDPRFTTDTAWPTVSTSTGYPVGIPTVAPSAIPVPPTEIGDPDRPYTNRPPNNPASVDPNQPPDPFIAPGDPLRTFTMPASAAAGTTAPDPWKQVPLMVGDWIDYAGTMYKINPLGPNTGANSYISIHTLTAHMGIKTAPGTNPAYIRVEEFLFGVGDRNGGPTVNAGDPSTPIAQETSSRAVLVSFTTNSDPNGNNLPRGSIFGISVNPTNGVETEVPFPNGNPGNVDFAIDDPIRGRLRWTTANNGSTAGTLANAAGPGNFYREYIVKLSSGQTPNVANGLTAGAYRLPIFEFLFGEGTTFGQPVPPFNFFDLGFLSGDFFGGMQVGALDPHPGGPPKGTPAIP